MSLLRRLDAYLLLPSLFISILSIFLLITTAENLFLPQLINMLFGVILYFIFASIDFRIWHRFNFLFYLISILFLIVIFFLPQVRGAHRWIDLGFFVLQPSEIFKPFIILFFSSKLSTLKNIKIKSLLILLLTFLPFLILIFLQPDLGNSIIYTLFFLGLLIIGGINISYLALGTFFFTIFSPALWFILKDYQQKRIFSFLNPNLDPGGAGYNAIQAMIAVGSGGLFGMGLGRGSQSRLLFLPEYQTDFIFASLVESLGLFGGSILLVLYLILLLRMLYIAINSQNIYGRILTIGVFCQILFQIIINVGMNLGILPITGITLPLLSYGGSSIVSTFISLGIINSVGLSLKQKPLVIR